MTIAQFKTQNSKLTPKNVLIFGQTPETKPLSSISMLRLIGLDTPFLNQHVASDRPRLLPVVGPDALLIDGCLALDPDRSNALAGLA